MSKFIANITLEYELTLNDDDLELQRGDKLEELDARELLAYREEYAWAVFLPEGNFRSDCEIIEI
jgi:hypothetical protein